MDKNNKQTGDFKNKPNVKYLDDDQKPSTSGYNQYVDKIFHDFKRNKTNKPNISQVSDQNPNCNFFDKNSINVDNADQSNMSRDGQFPRQQRALYQQVEYFPEMLQMNPCADYGYSAPGNFNIDSNPQIYPMMPQFNMYSAMNTQWPCYQMDPMCIPPNNMPVNAAPFPISTGMDMSLNSSGNVSGFNPYMPIANDMYNMTRMDSWNNYSMHTPDSIPIAPIKEIITLPNCSLIPPHPNKKISRRERPPGCKTVFVGHLPKNITEDIIREIFSRCGEIIAVRMSQKNFCHIRFAAMETVDKAMLLSEYRLKIENKDDYENSSDIHVDFAVARDDEYEWKCLQRAKEREIRHRQRSPTPPIVPHFSEREAKLLCDKLKKEETFKDAIHLFTYWLKHGECTKRTSCRFFSIIMSIQSLEKRLLKEKVKLEEELSKAKVISQEKMSLISLQFQRINKMFDLVKLPHIWNTFNETQKKSIDLMKQTTKDIAEAHYKAVIENRIEVDMDLSDDDGEVVEDKLNSSKGGHVAKNPSRSSKYTGRVNKKELKKLKTKLAVLKKQVQASLEKNAAVHLEIEKNACIDHELYFKKIEELKAKERELNKKRQEREEYVASHSQKRNEPDDREETQSRLNIQDEMSIIALITAFFQIFPEGASSQSIADFLQKYVPEINDQNVEALLQKYPYLFQAESSNIGADLTKIWLLKIDMSIVA